MDKTDHPSNRTQCELNKSQQKGLKQCPKEVAKIEVE